MHSNASFLAVSYGLSDISAVSLIGSVDGGGVSSSNLSASPEGNTIGLGWAAKLWKTRLDLGLARGMHYGSSTRSGQSASIDDLAGTVFASRVSLEPMAGFSPFAGLSVTRSRIDSINETGSGANLNVSKLNQSRTLGEVGLGYTRELSKNVALDLTTSVEHDFRSSKTAISASFADAGTTATPFKVEADAFGSTAVRGGAGLRYSLGKAGQIGAGYEFSGGNNLKASHEVRASYSIQF
jgi:outer membrane autotransporter protein